MTDNVVGLPQGSAQVSNRSAAVAPEPPDNYTYTVCDSQFMHDVAQLKALRSFMIRQAKTTQEAWKIELGVLNLFRFDAQGRFPNDGEWAELEHRSNELYRHLSEPDRRRFLYGQIPRLVIGTAIFLGIFVLASLVSAALFVPPAQKHLLFVASLTWVAALGGIGAIAFIGMNALAIQDDATFDITNRKLIGLRVMLGALFAVVLTLPFGFKSFVHFIQQLQEENGASILDSNAPSIAAESLLLLLPFVLGFSTTLVIMVLNQFVEAVQSFFGKKGSPPPAPEGSRGGPTVVALPSAGGPPHVVSPPAGAPPPAT
jgi:hypothetical protein